MRIGHHQRIGLESCDLGPDLGELPRRLLAGEANIVQADRAERRRRSIGPERVDDAGIDRHKTCAGSGAALCKSFCALDRMQPRIIAEPVAARQVGLDPLLGGRLDEMRDFEQRAIDLLARL